MCKETLEQEVDRRHQEGTHNGTAAHEYLDMLNSFSNAGLPLALDVSFADKLSVDTPAAA